MLSVPGPERLQCGLRRIQRDRASPEGRGAVSMVTGVSGLSTFVNNAMMLI